MLTRRTLFKGFALGAAGLLVPEPIKAYSFVGGWANPETRRGPIVVPRDGGVMYSESGALLWKRHRDGRVFVLSSRGDPPRSIWSVHSGSWEHGC